MLAERVLTGVAELSVPVSVVSRMGKNSVLTLTPCYIFYTCYMEARQPSAYLLLVLG